MAWKRVSLLELQMCNFKRFYGEHKIDLMSRPDEGKPIVLIGGLNGRGKTTIFEAINYSLFENEDLPGIQNRPSYLSAVTERFNRQAAKEGSKDFWVAVELLLSGNLPDRRIRIERRWEMNQRTQSIVQSELHITENGRQMEYAESDNLAYQDFLNDIIPPQIAPFFFFDGERIQEFANENSHEKALVDAIEDILHIKIYKQLNLDIKKNIIDYLEKNEIYDTTAIFDQQKEADQIENTILQNANRLDEINREREELERKNKRIAEEFRRLGGRNGATHEGLGAEQQRLQSEQTEVKNDINKCFERLPLLLAGELRDELRHRLELEQREFTTPEQAERLKKQISEIEARVLLHPDPSPPPEIALDEHGKAFYVTLFEKVAQEVMGFGKSGSSERLHDVSTSDRQTILDSLAATTKIGNELREALDRRERIHSELRALATQMQAMSDDPYVGELLADQDATSKKIGMLEREEQQIKGLSDQQQSRRAQLSRDIEALKKKRADTTRAQKAVQIARDAQVALDEFITKLSPRKLQLLQRYMDEMYSRLRKPEDPARVVEVDPDTWQIILKGSDNRMLERRVFSAGMREMYAISLLWALSQASGKQLPVIIDTPVGRLDSTNRTAFFDKYLIEAGHQVIVLSTDEEVDVDWARHLARHTAKQYRLDADLDKEDGPVRVVSGYFV